MAPLTPNRSLILKAIPETVIMPDVHMKVDDRPLDTVSHDSVHRYFLLADDSCNMKQTDPPPKGMIVRTVINAFDPHMRDRMQGPDFQSVTSTYCSCLGDKTESFRC
jgi:hypothetical protein